MFLLDTNAVIDFCNSKLPLSGKDFLIRIEPTISVVTQIELFASARISETEKNSLESFVSIATIYNTIDGAIVAKTIEIRQKYKTKLPDAIIAATALVHNLTIISRNTVDFKNIEGLKVIDPYNL